MKEDKKDSESLEDIKEQETTSDDNIKDEEPQTKEKKAPLGDRIDDAIDEIVDNVQDFFYGERTDYTHDIPATMPDPDNEIRHINKVQTRRNFNKRFGYKFLKWFFVLVGIGLVVSLIGGLIGKLLMA